MKLNEIVSSDPEIVSGAVVFAGTRVPVEALFSNLASGMGLDEFLENFPTVSREQAEAALNLAAKQMEAFHKWQNFESAA